MQKTLCIVHGGRALPHALMGEAAQRMGGSEVQLALIARRLARRGWEVSVALRGRASCADGTTGDGVRLVAVGRPERRWPGLRFLVSTVPELWRASGIGVTGAVLQMGLGWQTGLLVWACQRRRRRFVLWLASLADVYAGRHGDMPLKWHERWLARYGLRHADTIVVQTRDQQRLLWELHRRGSTVIPNLWPAPEQPWAPPTDPPEVLWAARVMELKRPHLVLDLAEALPHLRFVMAGGPAEGKQAYYEEVKARAETVPNVTFLGFVPFAEIDEHFQRAAVCLCTSTVEGFPNTFLQAWAHGRPVVSTFDPDEVLCEHRLGVHCRDFPELVQAVPEVCGTSVEYAELVRAYLRDYHSPEVIMPQVEAALLGE